MHDFRHDLRHAVRSLRKSPGFTVAATMTLAIGIGANTAVFALLSANLLRPLPFASAERLVVLHQTYAAAGETPRPMRWSYPEFEALRAGVGTLSHMAAYHVDDVNLSDGAGEPRRVRAEMVSSDYFPLLSVEPVTGRVLQPVEDTDPGAHPVVILGHALWVDRYGGDPAVLGRGVRLNNVPLTIIGVAPAGFSGLTGDAELWFPQAMAPQVYYAEQLTTPQRFHSVVGRLGPGVVLERARADVGSVGLAAIAAAREASGAGPSDATWGAALLPLAEARRDPAALRAQATLAGAALFVLLIAMVNLSALMLARATGRARETAVRSALGAGRLRLVRSGLVEGGIIGLLGGAGGVLLAVWSVPALVAVSGDGGGARHGLARLATFSDPTADWRVVAFGALLAVAAGVLSSIVPSLRAANADLFPALQAGGRGNAVAAGSLRRPTLLSAAAVVQVACAVVLLVGAGVLLVSFKRLHAIDPGFQPTGVVAFQISPPTGEYGDDRAAPLLEEVLARVEAVPGVTSASVSLCTPYTLCSNTSLYMPGRTEAEAPQVGRHYVGPDHFLTLGIPLLRGRTLTSQDRAGRARVAVINETAARRFWPGEDPIGRQVWFGSGGGFASPDSLTEIVGIVGDVLYAAPGEPVGADFYTSYLQFTWPYTTVLVRTDVAPLSLVPALRRAVAQVDPNLPIYNVVRLEDQLNEVLSRPRFATAVLATFAALGLLLAAVGIYGIMAYSVVQRRREIGIRLALGGTPAFVLRLIVGQGLLLAAAGLVIGVTVSLGVSGALPALFHGIEPLEPVVFAIVLPLLLAVALLACAVPALSATRVNPVETIATD
jgi:putative ABC transport system permease protein